MIERSEIDAYGLPLTSAPISYDQPSDPFNTTLAPIEPQYPAPTNEPAYTYDQQYPIETPPYNPDPYPTVEVPPMMNEPVCNCIAYPCDCDGGSDLPVRGIDQMPGGKVEEPYPIVDPPIVVSNPVPVIDGPVTTPPPVINVTVQTQTPSTQNAGAEDGEPTLIFGYPWYFVAGAAAAALFVLSSMDGKK